MDLQGFMQQMYSGAPAMPMMMPHPLPLPNGYGYGMAPGQQQPFCPFPPNGSYGSNYDRIVDKLEDEDEEENEQQRTLFCGNLDERVTEEILYEVFLQAGPIEGVHIPTDNTGRQRNYGFVTYQHLCAVPFALDLYRGLELFNKKLTIKQRGVDKAKQSPLPSPSPSLSFNQSRLRNPFMVELPSQAPPTALPPHHYHRHSLHGAKPYDRNPFGNNGDQRRRSDSSAMERSRPRMQPQQHHQHMQGGSRRSDQRHNNKRRLL
ncbi:RNA-binding protein 7-like [Drosophila elegans]|uniref:RNA-binding protein 7-like n=1 Tax=Drosophila elegans TaxID=30023 RepID=UPI0007E7C704|nr:RNA-binding protein 7-like [Drosophila elegans]